jgi:hypothetical protein
VAQRGVPVTGTVYQLRVVLAGISPMVWRRLLVPAETSIADLHAIMQTAFGWSDEHLHRFTIHAVEYGLWRPGSAGFSRDARQVELAGFGLRAGERFTYKYNFFAGWRHDIRVEQILPRSPRHHYPFIPAEPARRRRRTATARKSSWRYGSAGRRCSSPPGWPRSSPTSSAKATLPPARPWATTAMSWPGCRSWPALTSSTGPPSTTPCTP